MTIVQTKKGYKIDIPFTPLRSEQLKAIMELPERHFDAKSKCWVVPLHLRSDISQIVNYYNASFSIDTRGEKQDKWEEEFVLPDLDEVPVLKNGQLRPYQTQGVARGLQLMRYINGDEQGLGKTVQSTITLVEGEKRGAQTFPALIVCPSSTKINWEREWHFWTDKKAMVLRDKDKHNWHHIIAMGLADVIIVNYESLKKYFVTHYPHSSRLENSLDIQLDPRVELFKSIIVDESHRCKDPNAQQTKITLRLAMGKKWRILLTGTPVVNRPIDLYPQLAILGRLNQFGGLAGYKHRYCEAELPKNRLRELNWRLNRSCFFRREKKTVAKDLPEKQRQTMICEITTREMYDKAANDFQRYLEQLGYDDEAILKKMNGEIMVKMQELKRISAMGKINEVVGFTKEVLDGGAKLILFCSLHAIVDALKKEFPKAVTVTGRDSDIQKQNNIDAFQNDPKTQLIICNIKAAGVGITLTASSRVGFVEYPWTYADCVQCEDRAHRIGQPNNVMCTYFLGHKTIDEDMYRLIQSKATVANAINGATDVMKANFVNSVKEMFRKAV